jgi:hypothetical protein
MRRLIPVLVLTATLSAACGPDTPLDLDLRGININVLRVITPAVELVPPSPAPPLSLPPLPPFVVVPPPIAPSAPPAKAPDPCPKADAFAVPKAPVSPLVGSPPASETFTQISQGTFPGEITTTVTRLPSTVSETGQKVDSWTVAHTDPAHQSTDIEAYQLVHAGAVPSGVYLVGLAWKDPVRGEASFVATGLGVLVLPNPVAVDATGAGTQYAGAATDPSSLTTISLVRNVTGKKRVDVCGELVDTYTVAMTGTFVNTTVQYQLAWTQQLSTVYGAASIEDSMSLTYILGGAWNRTLHRTTVPKDLA